MPRPILFLVVLLLAACGGGPAANLNVGAAAPAFEAQRLDGATLRFPADLAGRPAAIRFWADWCRYCEGEMKAIEPVYRAYRARGFEMLAVNAGQDRETVAAFVGKLGVSYPALVDASAAIARQYGVTGLPTTFFVDSRGVVRAKIVGEADAATFERAVAALFKEGAP
jgi:peroxiredoxin